MKMLISLGRAFLALCFSLVLYPIGLFFWLLPERIRVPSRWYNALAIFWARGFVSLLGIKYTLEGRTDLLTDNNRYVLIANHESLLDGMVVGTLLGARPHSFLSKSSLKYLPFINIFFIRMHILVDRNNARKAVRALHKAIERAKRYKIDLVIFPEGKRHRDGRVHEFFHGYAKASIALNVPVVPIHLVGMHKLCTGGSWLVDSYAPPIKIRIGEPMVRGASESLEQFSERVRSWFL